VGDGGFSFVERLEIRREEWRCMWGRCGLNYTYHEEGQLYGGGVVENSKDSGRHKVYPSFTECGSMCR